MSFGRAAIAMSSSCGRDSITHAASPMPKSRSPSRRRIAICARMSSSLSSSSKPSMPKPPPSPTPRASWPPAAGVIGALTIGTRRWRSSVREVVIVVIGGTTPVRARPAFPSRRAAVRAFRFRLRDSRRKGRRSASILRERRARPMTTSGSRIETHPAPMPSARAASQNVYTAIVAEYASVSGIVRRPSSSPPASRSRKKRRGERALLACPESLSLAYRAASLSSYALNASALARSKEAIAAARRAGSSIVTNRHGCEKPTDGASAAMETSRSTTVRSIGSVRK